MDLASPGSIGGIMAVFQIINFFLFLLVFACSIYGFILFIKLAKRGIKALDIYIENNKTNKIN